MAFNWGSVDWGSVAQAGASLYASNQAAKAAKGAGNVAAQGSEAATALQREIYQDQRNLNMPFYNGGLQAYDQYRALMGLGGTSSQPQGDPAQAYLQANPDVAADAWFKTNPLQHYNQYGKAEGRTWGTPQQTPQQAQQAAFAAFRNTPGYQFGLDEGQKQLQSSASASGGLFSGKAGMALTRYGQNYADQQGYTPHMNRLAGLFGGAQTAGGQIGNAGQNFANQAGANMQNAANSRASGLLGSSQAKMWGLGQAGGFLNDAYGYYQSGGGR